MAEDEKRGSPAARPQVDEAARVEAEERAHDRVTPDDAYDAIGAVNLYVEAFLAGARFAEARRGAAR